MATASTAGITVPRVTLGTIGIKSEDVKSAFQEGIKWFDTAKVYKNEKLVGEALEGLDVVIITKLAEEHLASEEVMAASVKESLELLKTIKVVVLMHSAYESVDMLARAKELQAMVDRKEILGWGVSNFDKAQLQYLVNNGMKPLLNQYEYSPYFQRPELSQLHIELGVQQQSFRCIAQRKVLKEQVVIDIAKDKDCSDAEVIYGWMNEKGLPIVVKASGGAHQEKLVKEPVKLNEEEMNKIAGLKRVGDDSKLTGDELKAFGVCTKGLPAKKWKGME